MNMKGNQYRLLFWAIIVVGLVSALFHHFEQKSSEERWLRCGQNLWPYEGNQDGEFLGAALYDYSLEHAGSYPERLDELVPKYIKALPVCPSTGTDTYSAGYKTSGVERRDFALSCTGNHESWAPTGYPRIHTIRPYENTPLELRPGFPVRFDPHARDQKAP
jgi:hypothetical protein